MAGCAAAPLPRPNSAPQTASPAPSAAPTRTPTVASDAVIVTIGDSIMSGYGLDPDEVLVVNDWAFTGAGYRSDAERELALGIAERLRTQRQQQYRKENTQ